MLELGPGIRTFGVTPKYAQSPTCLFLPQSDSLIIERVWGNEMHNEIRRDDRNLFELCQARKKKKKVYRVVLDLVLHRTVMVLVKAI